MKAVKHSMISLAVAAALGALDRARRLVHQALEVRHDGRRRGPVRDVRRGERQDRPALEHGRTARTALALLRAGGFDAVFCGDDILAMGALDACVEQGFTVAIEDPAALAGPDCRAG